MKLGDFNIDGNRRAFIIAEIAQAHEGSLGLAHSYIDAVADAGADAIKFQTHIASEESTIDEGFRVKMSGQDRSRWDYWKRMEFSKAQWQSLVEHSRERGLVFMSSAFSIEAVKLLDELGVDGWKVGSGEFFNQKLISEMVLRGGPILLSTGLANTNEIDTIHNFLMGASADFSFFQCTTSYPVSLSKVGLNVLPFLKKRYVCPVGLSDHSGTVYPILMAMANSVDFIEAHVVFDKRMYGPDTSSSITLDQLKFIVDANRAFETLRMSPVDKNIMAPELAGLKDLFTKSVCLKNDLKSGAVLTKDDLTLKKPGTGIPAEQIESLIGRSLVRDVSSNRLLQWSDLLPN